MSRLKWIYQCGPEVAYMRYTISVQRYIVYRTTQLATVPFVLLRLIDENLQKFISYTDTRIHKTTFSVWEPYSMYCWRKWNARNVCLQFQHLEYTTLSHTDKRWSAQLYTICEINVFPRCVDGVCFGCASDNWNAFLI